MPEDAEKIGESVRTYLGMTLKPVGIKIYETDVSEGAKPAKPIHYCRAVRDAAKGQSFLIRLGDEACAEAEVVLGFRDPKYVNIEPRVKTRTKAIRIGPLQDADHVIFILNPEQAMTLSLLLDGVNGRFKGQISICGEISAQIAIDGQPNFSLLCDGARLYGEYEVGEVAFGLPYGMFLRLPEKMSAHSSLSHKAKEGLKHLFMKIR
ncbi:MAG: DUF169 domain-containing protein [Chloroflexi bacterium]|nr:DUF169 domain-containing protein [Chloroflexota bacterium]